MRSRSRGFTLVEVLIALVLLSLIMTGLVASLRTFGDTASRIETRIEHAEEVRLVGGFLQQVIGDLLGKQVTLEDGQVQQLFFGSAEELIWLAPMPAHHGVGGLHMFRLRYRARATDPALTLQFAPYFGINRLPDWAALEQRDLLTGLQHLELAYQAAGSRDWLASWTDPQAFPARIRIRLEQRDRYWPELVIPLTGAEAMALDEFDRWR